MRFTFSPASQKTSLTPVLGFELSGQAHDIPPGIIKHKCEHGVFLHGLLSEVLYRASW